MSDGPNITLAQQLSAAHEILNNRRAGYPKMVQQGKVRQSEADYRIALLEAIVGTFNTLVHGARLVDLLRQVDAAVPTCPHCFAHRAAAQPHAADCPLGLLVRDA